MIAFAERLKFARKTAALSQQELGKAINVSKAAISSMEIGRTKAPTPKTLFKLAKVLNCDPEWLATGKGAINSKVNWNSAQPEIVKEIQKLCSTMSHTQLKEALKYFEYLKYTEFKNR